MSKPNDRIVGGDVVPENSTIFNFTVRVFAYLNETYFTKCGGSLLSPNYVITAGHFII
jgi:secreted trypsin-like serine protease